MIVTRPHWLTWATVAAVVLAAIVAAILSVAGGSASLSQNAAAAPEKDEPPPALADYRLIDSRTDVPWHPRAGRYGHAGDVSVLSDGRVVVLDTLHATVHLHMLSNEPEGIWQPDWEPVDPSAPSDQWRPVRMDVGPGNTTHVLVTGPVEEIEGGSRVRRGRLVILDSDGTIQHAHAVSALPDERFADIAVTPDGRTLIVRTSGDIHNRGTYGIDIVTSDGRTLGTFVPPSVWIPVSADVAPDGTVWIVGRSSHDHAPDGGNVYGQDAVHAFDASLNPIRELQFAGGMDISVGAAGVLVTRDSEIWRLDPDAGTSVAVHAGPIAERNHYTEPPLGAANVFNIDQRSLGDVVAATAHCSFQGLTVLPSNATGGFRAARTIGALDRPPLAGPLLPWRISAATARRASDGLAVLQGPVEDAPVAEPGTVPVPIHNGPRAFAHQSVQSWSHEGELDDQYGTCGPWSQPWGVRDVGHGFRGDVYVSTEDRVTAVHRPTRSGDEDRWPVWLAADEVEPDAAAHAVAMDANMLVAALDLGLDRIHVFSEDGLPDPLTTRASRTAPSGVLARDIATADGTITVLYSDGTVSAPHGLGDGLAAASAAQTEGRWVAPGQPIALDTDGPQIYGAGRQTVLHEGGWVTVHEPYHGGLLATIPPVDDRVAVTDITVDSAGQIHTAWLDADRTIDWLGERERTQGVSMTVHDAGMWVHAAPGGAPSAWAWPPGAQPVPPAAAGSCLVAPAITSSVIAADVGERVTGTLRVRAHCPRSERPIDLIMAVDISSSTGIDGAMDRMRSAAMRVLSTLGSDARVALITFDSQRAMRWDPDEGITRIARVVAALEPSSSAPGGGGAMLAQATTAFADVPPVEDARRVLLLVTDGRLGELPSADTVGDAFDARHMLVLPGAPLARDAVDDLRDWTSAPGKLSLDGTPFGVDDLVTDLRAGHRPDAELARLHAEITVPPGWTLVPDRAAPPGTLDGLTVRWELDRVADGSAIRWQLEADQPGRRPVAAHARLRWTDGHGLAGARSIRAPMVSVGSGGTIWLPSLIDGVLAGETR